MINPICRLLITSFLLTSSVNVAFSREPVKQINIDLVEHMPDMPVPYKMKNWDEIARKQDQILFDHTTKATLRPLIWWDDTKTNIPVRAFGLPSYVGALRNMEEGNHYESLPTIGAVLGASLAGIDKSNDKGNDYVTMTRQLYVPKYGLVLNSPRSKPGGSFWYEIFPTMAFTMLTDLYPSKPEMSSIVKSCADTWNHAVKEMSAGKSYPDFNYTSYDFFTKKLFYNDRWREPDAAGGVAWLQYMAWVKWGDQKYLDASKKCMDFLQARDQKEGVFYEIIMPYGALLAVRMNAEQGTAYDELKMLNWCFDGNNADRKGWGVISESWEGYDVHGLVGQKKAEQYAFAMNTYSHAAALIPVVKYNPAYARTIGKWILNLANASRLFYADEHPRNRQSSAIWDGDPDHVICYEGVRKNLTNGNSFETLQGVLAEKGPYAVGDQVKCLRSLTDICIYGSAWVGMLAAIVDQTNVEGILQLDCNATDFFGQRSNPTYLFYNPYKEVKKVNVILKEGSFDLYDLVKGGFIAKGVKSGYSLAMESDNAVCLVALPAGKKTFVKNGRLLDYNGNVIDYRYK